MKTVTHQGILPTRTLGDGLRVSALGFGAMGMSEFYGPSDDAASRSLLQEVVERGVTLIDTADMYGQGHNEQLIGDLLKMKPHMHLSGQLKISTKCGIERSGASSSSRRINNTPSYIRASCEGSLKRLGVDRIDLYYIHRVDPEVNIEDTMGCLAELVREGKIAHVGLCEVSAKTLERAHRVHPVAALQTEYSLWSREVEQDILPTANKLGIGFVAYSPLGRGFLTGRLKSRSDLAVGDFRLSNPRFEEQNLSHNLRLLESIQHVAENYGVTRGQVALAWLLAQGPCIVPIPGTRRSSYLQENLGALTVSLSSEDLKFLGEAMTSTEVRGARYGSAGMQGIDA
ncbi:aldo/keto reductase [Metapseudomonas furukawaii]|uniref:aldo/keto reductase n=1 Tax=Metapseudomonas furukawaii TaxID=1149133 RepID=UPI0002AC82AA|nr:aldo/keto reductase [Pseudomonas furukawaii]ELS24884.1 Aldo-keto reductase [Pseudomonas furukawaii]